tara:strand:+ start:1238 stop:1735 length:498 start_codon:yes stop_codon:yes gene_type:complete
MEINKNTIISSICGISSNITIENFSKHLGLDIDEVIEFDYGDLGDLEGTSQLNENNGTLVFSWEGPEDHGITKLLKDVLGEEYLLRVDTNISYGNDSYIEIIIFDNKKEIVENVLKYDGEELTEDEKTQHDDRDQDDYYIDSEDISFIKKSECDINSIKGKPIVY